MSGKVVVSFSGRPDGNCAGVGEYAARLLRGEHVRFAELRAEPCGGCGCECLRGGACPKQDGVSALYEKLSRAQECAFVLPNYADFPCAHYFIFSERGTGFFAGSEERLAKYMAVPKKAIVISGGEEENFRRALAYQADRMELLFLRAKDFGQKSADGRLAQDERVRALVRLFLQGSV